MAFPSAWLDELFSKNDIVSVVSSYVDLKPKGRKLWACCPLHGEKTPSFTVSPDKQLFYCFGCHAGGTVVQFVMDIERLSYPEAIRFLAERVGMEMPSEVNDRALMQARAHRNRLFDATKAAARFYFECFVDPAKGQPGQAYAKARGLEPEIIKRFGIGYAPDGWDNLQKHLIEKGFTQKELLDAGLLVHNESSNRTYDAYRNRLIFPILGENGRVLGFGARVLNNDKPKYINTGDTPIYNKRKNLYGLYLHKNEKLSDLVMVEGYMDVIGLYKAGVKNAVASLGTALTQQQAHLLKRYVQTVYIAYDGDAAGQSATLRGLDILRAEGLTVRVIVFPDGLDPDEYVQAYGKDGFDRLKEHAYTLNEFKLLSLKNGANPNDENERERYAARGAAFVETTEPVERDRLYRLLAKETGYSIEVLKAQGKRSGGRPIETPSTPVYRGGVRRRKDETADPRLVTERTLLAACLRDRAALLLAKQEGADKLIRNDALLSLFVAMQSEEAFSLSQYVSGLEQDAAETVSSLLKDEGSMQNPGRTVTDCIERLRRSDGQVTLEELQKQLADPHLSAEEKANLLQRISTQIKAKK